MYVLCSVLSVAASYTKVPETSGIVLSKTLHCCSILNIRDVQSLESAENQKQFVNNWISGKLLSYFFSSKESKLYACLSTSHNLIEIYFYCTKLSLKLVGYGKVMLLSTHCVVNRSICSKSNGHILNFFKISVNSCYFILLWVTDFERSFYIALFCNPL